MVADIAFVGVFDGPMPFLAPGRFFVCFTIGADPGSFTGRGSGWVVRAMPSVWDGDSPEDPVSSPTRLSSSSSNS